MRQPPCLTWGEGWPPLQPCRHTHNALLRLVPLAEAKLDEALRGADAAALAAQAHDRLSLLLADPGTLPTETKTAMESGALQWAGALPRVLNESPGFPRFYDAGSEQRGFASACGAVCRAGTCARAAVPCAKPWRAWFH